MMATATSGLAKICSGCHSELDLSRFSRNKRQGDGLQNYCKTCMRKSSDAWYRKRIATDHDYHLSRNRLNVLKRLLRRYSLTQERYEELVNKGCGICGGSPNGRGRYHFDHDHTTGKFRGLLCSKCNTGVGHFEDGRLLSKALEYWERTCK